MKIYIDADGSPVVNLAIQISKKYEIEIIAVKNYAVELQSSYAKIISVDISNDSADLYIVNNINKGDIVITQDYGLAALCLTKKAIPINQNGFIFTDDNIDYMLNKRHINQELRKQGKKHSNQSKRSKEQNKQFKHSFSKLIESLITKN